MTGPRNAFANAPPCARWSEALTLKVFRNGTGRSGMERPVGGLRRCVRYSAAASIACAAEIL